MTCGPGTQLSTSLCLRDLKSPTARVDSKGHVRRLTEAQPHIFAWRSPAYSRRCSTGALDVKNLGLSLRIYAGSGTSSLGPPRPLSLFLKYRSAFGTYYRMWRISLILTFASLSSCLIGSSVTNDMIMIRSPSL